MPQGRIVLKAICQSKKLADLKTDGARLLYTWLIPNVDIHGCFSGDPAVIKGQVFTRLRKTTKIIAAYLEDLVSVGLIVWYESNGDAFLQIPDFADKQPSLNPSKEAESAIPPPTPEQLQTNSRLTLPKVKGSKVKLKERKVKGKNFTPPKLQEIQQLIQERGYSVDPNRFLNFYASKGWMVGKNKMKDWRAALAGWEGRGDHAKQKSAAQLFEESADAQA